MNEENFLIQFIPAKHCFLHFSFKWFQKLNNAKCACVKLIHPQSKQELRLTWAPQPSYGMNDCSVGINATFAQGLTLQENEIVLVSSEDRVPLLMQVYLTPLSADDYQILEVSQESVEGSMLNQVRVVNTGQVLTVWVTKTMQLKLTVDRLVPASTHGKLEQLTELFIQNVPKIVGFSSSKQNNDSNIENHSKPTSIQLPDNLEPDQSLWRHISNYIPNSLLQFLQISESVNVEISAQRWQADNSQLLCRVHPHPHPSVDCCGGLHNQAVHPFNVFISNSVVQKKHCWPKNCFVESLQHNTVALCRLEPVLRIKLKPFQNDVNKHGLMKSQQFDNSKSECVCVRLYQIEESCKLFSSRTNISCVYLSQFLMKLLNLTVGSKVRLTLYNPPNNVKLSAVTLTLPNRLSSESGEDVCSWFAERLVGGAGVLVNGDSPLPVRLADGSWWPVLVTLASAGGTLPCWPLTRAHLLTCRLTVSTEHSAGALTELDALTGFQQVSEDVRPTISVFNNLVEEGLRAVEFGLELLENHPQPAVTNHILITGKVGSGKSTLRQALCDTLSGPPHYLYVSVIDCKSLRGKKSEAVVRIVTEHLIECLYHQPAALVMEDLHCIAAAKTNDLEPSHEDIYFLRLAAVLRDLLWNTPGVSVVATAESRSKLHPQLQAARSRHLFSSFLHVPMLNKEERQQVLTKLVSEKAVIGEPELRTLVAKTEGCVARDLQRLVNRLLFNTCQRTTEAPATVTVIGEDVEAALLGFLSSELLGIGLAPPSPITFTSVGGLTCAKNLLTETIIWPTKFKEVFSQCPLPLERGVLLYGAPGTGKTLLAQAIAGESGLNFITVKGPELLSKYIGASEEAVRNVFQKAQSAQPCILFFDEFDSLAPRRGHDSTGVTDRVVNQLLTQMDGVEALEGVWVVGAASRPDLLDPALLRPGRIGTLVHCPLPDQEERLAILQSLSNALQLSADCDLAFAAAHTDGFTGADLQGVLYTAQMNAYTIQNQGLDDEVDAPGPTAIKVVVTQADLLAALRESTPSLQPRDRLRFQHIYEWFEQRGSSEAEGALTDTALRVTLA